MSSGRRRTTDRHYSAEEQALDQISKEAEERIQARRQARAEAREIRLKEIERQQKEEEEKQKAQSQGSDAKSISSYSGSRRGSNESTESDVSSKDSRDPKDQVRQFKNQLRELEEKYKAAMVTNAQLDNTKTSQVFQLELLKEQLEEQEEGMIEVQREYKDKCREYDLLKRDHENLKLEFDGIKQQIELKDKLLKESGLVIVTTDEGEFSLTKCSNMSDVPIPELGSSIISEEAADLLKKAGEGTLGNASVKAESVDNKTEGIESVVENKVNGDKDSPVANVEGEVRSKNSGSEDILCDDGLDHEKLSKSSEGTEKVNNNSEIQITGKDTPVEADIEMVREESKSETVVVNDDKGEDKGSESDDSEVFYESKSEVSIAESVGVSGEEEKGEGCESKGVGSEREGKLSESERLGGKENNVKNINDIACVKSTEDKLSVSERLEVNQKSGSVSSVKKLVYCASGISLESDVTYHSESDEEVETEVKQEVLSTNNEKVNIDFGDEKVLMRDNDNFYIPTTENVGWGSNVEFRLDSEEVCIPLVLNTDTSEVSESKEDKVIDSQEEVYTSLSHNDEVFMQLPSGEVGNEQNMIEFAKNFVSDIVLKSVDLYNKDVKDEKIMLRKQSDTAANIDISIPKRHYSEELVDTASSVIPRKLSSGGSVEITSPVVHLPSEKSGDLKFFTYKVDTDADVVLTSIEEEKNPFEGKDAMDGLQSPVSGFGICYAGVKGHSDIDSDSGSEGDEEEGTEMGSGVEFISIPVATDNINNATDDIKKNKGDVKGSKVENNVEEGSKVENDVEEGSKVENKVEESIEVENNVEVADVNSADKSDESKDTNVADNKADEDNNQGENVDKIKEDLVNDLNLQVDKEVERETEAGGDLNKFYKETESEVSKMMGSKNETFSEKENDTEENSTIKLDGDKNVIPEEGATGGEKDEEFHSGPNVSKSVDSSPEAGSRLSGEISPNEESGQSVDSNSGKHKKKGSKKRGSKKQSKEECLIS